MEIKPALGVNIKDHGPEILEGRRWRASEKIDGVRRLFYNGEDITCFSRTGKDDPWLKHITDFLELPWFQKGLIYDCELVDRKLYLENADSFLIRAATTGKAAQQYSDNKKDLMAICFDVFDPEGDLKTGQERDNLLTSIFTGLNRSESGDPMIMVPTYGIIEGGDMDAINSLMVEVTSKNKEGIMLMDLDTPYIQGRSKNLIKVKRFEEFIGEIIDIEMAKEGTKIEGGVAALICDVPGCNVPVRVGTGFSNDQRLYLAENNPIGLRVEIEAFGRTKDRFGNSSLSMPVYKDSYL